MLVLCTAPSQINDQFQPFAFGTLTVRVVPVRVAVMVCVWISSDRFQGPTDVIEADALLKPVFVVVTVTVADCFAATFATDTSPDELIVAVPTVEVTDQL